MKLFLLFLLTAAKCFILTRSAGIPDAEDQSKIVGGYDAKPYSHPYVVSLQTRFLHILRVHVCGGALLNSYFVLSAAHCEMESWLIRWLPMDAVAGMYNVNRYISPVQVIQVKERIPHPLYKGGIGPHDIALFKTMAPFRFTSAVQPISLTSNFRIKPSQSSYKLLGWGALRSTFIFPDLPNNLQEVKVEPMTFKDCYYTIEDLKESYEENPLDPHSHLCTGSKYSTTAACVGDSGGPLVQINTIVPLSNDPIEHNTEMYNASSNCPNNKCSSNNKKGKPHHKIRPNDVETLLIGIVSWGVSPCGEPGAPTIYTNVSSYLDFINYNIGF